MSKRILILVAVCLTGCETFEHEPIDDGAYIMMKGLQDIEIENGINRKEASIILDCYWAAYSTVSGSPAITVETEGHWIATPYIGAAAIPHEDKIKIDKQTGSIEWERGPTIQDPKTIQIQPSRR